MESLSPLVRQLIYVAIIALAMVFGGYLYKRRNK